MKSCTPLKSCTPFRALALALAKQNNSEMHMVCLEQAPYIRNQ